MVVHCCNSAQFYLGTKPNSKSSLPPWQPIPIIYPSDYSLAPGLPTKEHLCIDYLICVGGIIGLYQDINQCFQVSYTNTV